MKEIKIKNEQNDGKNLQFHKLENGWCSDLWEIEDKIYCFVGGKRGEKCVRQQIQQKYNAHISLKRILKSFFKNKNGKTMFCVEKGNL